MKLMLQLRNATILGYKLKLMAAIKKSNFLSRPQALREYSNMASHGTKTMAKLVKESFVPVEIKAECFQPVARK